MKNLKLTLKASPIIAAAVIGLCCLTQWGAKFFFGIDLPEQNQLHIVRECVGWNSRFANILFMVLVFAPISEEIIFRLFLFKLPMKLFRASRTLGWMLIALIGSAIFSAAHYPDWQAIITSHKMAWMPLSNAFLALFVFGFLQCWLYRKTTWLWSPMLNHFIFNLLNLILLFTLPSAA